jgi:hypothetical protein
MLLMPVCKLTLPRIEVPPALEVLSPKKRKLGRL